NKDRRWQWPTRPLGSTVLSTPTLPSPVNRSDAQVKLCPQTENLEGEDNAKTIQVHAPTQSQTAPGHYRHGSCGDLSLRSTSASRQGSRSRRWQDDYPGWDGTRRGLSPCGYDHRVPRRTTRASDLRGFRVSGPCPGCANRQW